MKLLHNILKASTLSTALFIFQACYGTPVDYWGGEFSEVTFKVMSAADKSPLEGIRVNCKDGDDWVDCGKTNSKGMLTIFATRVSDEFSFVDPDGNYSQLDTTFNTISETYEIPLRLK